MPDRVEIRAGVVDVWSIARFTKNLSLVNVEDNVVVNNEFTNVNWSESHFRALLAHNGGRGVKGGLSEYARMLGKSEAYIRQVKAASQVIENLEVNYEVFLDKAQHLAAIHKAPAELWPTYNGGRGVKGGLSEYARMLGRNKQDISTYKQGAEVLKSVKLSEYSDSFLNKAAHLAAIHNFYSQIIVFIGSKTA